MYSRQAQRDQKKKNLSIWFGEHMGDLIWAIYRIMGYL